jgi:hypothetical protein
LTLSGDGSFIYTPASGYFGGDHFSYQAADSSGDYATAMVTLTVAAALSASISGPAAGGAYGVGQWVPTTFSCGDGAGRRAAQTARSSWNSNLLTDPGNKGESGEPHEAH